MASSNTKKLCLHCRNQRQRVSHNVKSVPPTVTDRIMAQIARSLEANIQPCAIRLSPAEYEQLEMEHGLQPTPGYSRLTRIAGLSIILQDAEILQL